MNLRDLGRIPANATALSIDVSPTDRDASRIVIFDRTGLTDDAGEWGNEVTAFDGDMDDVEFALGIAGFTVTWHSNYNFGYERGELYTATRAAD